MKHHILNYRHYKLASMKVSECLPLLKLVAAEFGLNLGIQWQWDAAYRILRFKTLNN